MLKYCIKIFNDENELLMQFIVPAPNLMNFVEELKQYGIVKVFIIDEQDNERIK